MVTNPTLPESGPTRSDVFGTVMADLPFRLSGKQNGIEWRVVLLYLGVAALVLTPAPAIALIPLILLALGETRLQT